MKVLDIVDVSPHMVIVTLDIKIGPFHKRVVSSDSLDMLFFCATFLDETKYKPTLMVPTSM